MTSPEDQLPNGTETDAVLSEPVIDGARLGAIGSLVCDEASIRGGERIDTFDELLELERQADAIRFIRNNYAQSELSPLERALALLNRSRHSVNHIGNQFATKILPCFLETDVTSAWEAFSVISPHTTDEELVLLTNQEQFVEIHDELAGYLTSTEETRRGTVESRLAPQPGKDNPDQGAIAKNDRYQFNGNETARSLERILENGIQVGIDPDGLEYVKQAYEQADDGVLPVLELVKNAPVLEVSGFMSSKISLAVHDTLDHGLGFMVANNAGLLDKFSSLLESIGNPQHTDIFKREGEAIASIAFGVRYWANLEHGFVPLVGVGDLLGHMDKLFDADQLSEQHMRSYKLLRDLGKNPSSRESQSLGFVFINYVLEIDEQRRKHGKIKQKDPQTKKIIGELDAYDPDYLALFVELHHELLDSRNKHRDNLLRFHILLEEYLCAIGSGKLEPGKRLSVRVQDMDSLDFSQTPLPPARIFWMTRNYGFSAIRDAIL